MALKKYFSICLALLATTLVMNSCVKDDEGEDIIDSVENSKGKAYITETENQLVLTIDIKDYYVEKWTCDFENDVLVKSIMEFEVASEVIAKSVYEGLVASQEGEDGEEVNEENKINYVLNGTIISADITAQVAGASKTAVRNAMRKQLTAFAESNEAYEEVESRANVGDAIMKAGGAIISGPIPLPTHK